MNPYLNKSFMEQSSNTRKQLVEQKYLAEQNSNRYSLYMGAGIALTKNKLIGPPSGDGLIKVALAGFELEVRITDTRNPKVRFAIEELSSLREAIAELQEQYIEDYGLDRAVIDKVLNEIGSGESITLVHQTCRPAFKDRRLEVVREVIHEYRRLFHGKSVDNQLIELGEWFNAGTLEFVHPTTGRR